jgi:hypothetical protein
MSDDDFREVLEEMSEPLNVSAPSETDAQTEELLAALAERGIYSRGDLERAIPSESDIGLDVKRLADALHECLPDDPEEDESGAGEPFCQYLAHAVAGRYDDPEWPVQLADPR